MANPDYLASPIKRGRATKADMEMRAAFLIARAHGPISVQGLYYQAEVHGLPSIVKTESGDAEIQAQVLAIRRAKHRSYEHISDATRWMCKTPFYDISEEVLREWSRTYHRNLWRDEALVEVWWDEDAPQRH